MANPASHNNEAPVKYKTIVYFICTVAALGGLLFGLDQGFIANSLDTIQKVYSLNVEGAEHYAAALAWGGILGALLSGIFARFLGRKKSLIFAGFLFSACSVISAFLPPLGMLTICRFMLGFAVGVASFIVPLYLSETAPVGIRGSMGTLFQLMITLGIFLISLTNVLIAKLFTSPSMALPLMFLVIGIFALLMFLGAFILPESPRWLLLKERREEGRKVLQKTLTSENEVNFAYTEIQNTLKETKSVSNIIFKGYFLKILVVGILLQMFQQLVGINLMVYYSPTIFGYAGMKGFYAVMAVPTVFLIFTFPAIRLVEKLGRKKLLYIGGIMMLITMLAAGLAFLSIGNSTDSASISAFPKAVLLISMVIYIIGFAFTWGPVVWLMCSEIFPLEGREVGMTITTMVNWNFAGLVMYNSLTVMKDFGNASIFFVFAFFCLISLVFVRFLVPETKGITLEEFEADLRSGVPLRKLGTISQNQLEPISDLTK
ncbi:MAG: MFS transporter [Lentisphaerae bacterium GWF2_38_69]|nr:MAG: MFS transporter [Lentisphaerae bacterium GWF2_38_69]